MCLLTLLVMVQGTTLKAQEIEKIQTAIIFQLTRLIDWCPNGKQGNFTIGLLGEETKLLNELNALQGRKVSDQPIVVKTITNLSDAGKINILFVPRSRAEEIPGLISAIGSTCTLVVADKPGAASQGAAISFVEVNGKVHFEINRSYAERHSLSVNNKLLELAMNVY